MISRWRLEATRERVWDLLTNPAGWPDWWPYLAAVRQIASGDSDGMGARHAFRWRSGLGYELHIVMSTRRVERWRELEGAASGDLCGIGLWVIEDDAPGAIRVTYRWDVELNKPWMRLLAPALRPVFAWRHFVVMTAGARGLARRLGCRLSDIEEWSAITPLASGVAAD
jgi:hypothetical protein